MKTEGTAGPWNSRPPPPFFGRLLVDIAQIGVLMIPRENCCADPAFCFTGTGKSFPSQNNIRRVPHLLVWHSSSWWRQQNSNLWPSACEADALPAELCLHMDGSKKGGDPDGNRTRVTAVKGRCLNRLTTGPLVALTGFEPVTLRVWTACSSQLSYKAVLK